MAFHKGKTEAGPGGRGDCRNPPRKEFKAQCRKVRRIEGKTIVRRVLVEHAGTENH